MADWPVPKSSSVRVEGKVHSIATGPRLKAHSILPPRKMISGSGASSSFDHHPAGHDACASPPAFFCIGQCRARVGLLACHGQRRVAFTQRQPGRAVAETKILFGIIPGHGRTATIPAIEQRIIKTTHRIAKLVAPQIHFRQPQFLALIDQRRTSQGQQQRQHRLYHLCA